MQARRLVVPLLAVPLALVACGGAQKAAPTAGSVVGALPQAQALAAYLETLK